MDKPPTRSLSVAEAREQLAEMLNEVKYAKRHAVVTKHGKRVAAVVSIEDLELLERLEDFVDVTTALERLADAREGKSLSWDDVSRELTPNAVHDKNRSPRAARTQKGRRK